MVNNWQKIKLQDAATVTGDGNIIFIGNNSHLTIVVSGTSTSFSVSFKCALSKNVPSDQWVPLEGIRRDSMSYTSTASVMSTGYEVEVSKWAYFKAQITAIDNGNVTVTCNPVIDPNS